MGLDKIREELRAQQKKSGMTARQEESITLPVKGRKLPRKVTVTVALRCNNLSAKIHTPMGEEIKYSSSAKITQQRRLKIQLALTTAWRLENLLARSCSTWFSIICAAICSCYTYSVTLACLLEQHHHFFMVFLITLIDGYNKHPFVTKRAWCIT